MGLIGWTVVMGGLYMAAEVGANLIVGDPVAEMQGKLAALQARETAMARGRYMGQLRYDEHVAGQRARFNRAMQSGAMRMSLSDPRQLPVPERNIGLADLVAGRIGMSSDELRQRLSPKRLGDQAIYGD